MLTITHEDNMELMARYPDKHFDLAICDPPYGIGAENHAGKAENGWSQWDRKDWDTSIPKAEYFYELRRVSRNQIVWGGNYFSSNLPSSMGWVFWDKGQRDFSLADGELAWTSFDRALRVFELSRSEALQDGKIHPTQKPVALYKWLLSRYAKPGDKILDTHLGSGSIAIACHDLGFDLTACELDKDYFDAAMKRIKEHQSQSFLFEPEPEKTCKQVELI